MQPLVVSFVLILLVITTHADDPDKYIENPVLWVPSSKPVIEGFNVYDLTLELISPCTLITDKILHPSLVVESRRICDALYEQHIGTELETMCEKNDANLHSRKKRFVITGAALLVGAITAFGSLAVGLGICGWQIAETKSQLNAVQAFSEKNAVHLNVITEAVNKLQTQINNVTSLAVKTDNKLNEFMMSTPASNFLTAKIMYLLTEGQAAIKDARLNIRDRKLPLRLLNYLNITYVCGDNCRLDLGEVSRCRVGKNQIRLTFTIPVVNSTLQILKADSFDMTNFDNETVCVYGYKGPSEILVSKTGKCVISKTVAKGKYILSPDLKDTTCESEQPDSTVHYSINKCLPRSEVRNQDFIQIKTFNNEIYIYCNENAIQIGKKERVSCGQRVLIANFGEDFVINNKKYLGGNFIRKIEQTHQPWLIQANYQLQRPLMVTDIITPNPHYSSTSEKVGYFGGGGLGLTGILCIVFGSIIVLLLVVGVWYFKKNGGGDSIPPQVYFWKK